jgi:glycosyltransferase involved in cell wall biosynthesis
VRVVFVAHSYPRHEDDMAGSFLLRLARALRGKGVDVRVVAPSARGLAAADEFDGIRVERYRYAPRALETLAYTGTMADAVRASWGARAALGGLLVASAAAARRAVRAWRADLVHAHWWFPGGAAVATRAVRAGRPLVVTMHGSDVRLARAIAPARAAYARVAGQAAAVTAVSSYLCAESTAMAPAVACAVAPMPVDAGLFTPPPPGTPREGVLFVGRLTRQKGVDALLRAAAVGEFHGPVTVCGAGPEERALRALADELGLASRVRWLPQTPQPELTALYRSAVVVAMPSHEEGLGLVAVEAGLCGTPVVGFRSGGLVDVVLDGESGALVAPGDVGALARALGAFTRDPERARTAGVRALGMAAAFTPEAAAVRYRDVYAAALAGSAGARHAA